MKIIGLNIGKTNNGVVLKDGGCCLIEDGIVKSAIAEERISRKKYDAGYRESLKTILDHHGYNYNDIDYYIASTLGETTNLTANEVNDLDFLRSRLDDTNKIKMIPSHHLSHAYSVFPFSGFDEALIGVIDMEGSIIGNRKHPEHRKNALERFSIFVGKKNKDSISIDPLKRFFDEENVVGPGEMYGNFTHFLGFESYVNSGKTMGLSSYGKGEMFQNTKLFEYNNGKPYSNIANNYHDSSSEISDYLSYRGFDGIHERKPDEKITGIHEELAHLIQKETEDIIIKNILELVEKTGIKNICLSGGVALNCVLNYKLLNKEGVDGVFVQPGCGDTGQCLGNAVYGSYQYDKGLTKHDSLIPYLGLDFTDEEISKTVKESGFRYEKVKDITGLVAKLLKENNIIGRFQGRSEFGPRALGNRSILANPCIAGMKDHINHKVKHREPFRPFAPIVMEDEVDKYFDIKTSSPYMLFACNVKEIAKEKIPAIVHYDGTARLQTVNEKQNPLIYKLLKDFKDISGVGVLLNTSLNDGGDPLVEGPEDALICFSRTGLDYLVMNDYIIYKEEKDKPIL